MGQVPPTISATRAVILNREHVRWLDVPTSHAVVDNGAGGWRLSVEEPTRIAAHLDDRVLRLDLAADGFVLAAGNEIYVSVADEPDGIVIDVGGGSVSGG